MSLKKALNVFVVAFWVCAQTAMAYAYDVSGASAHGTHKSTEVHQGSNSDCLNHVQTDEDSQSHHDGSSMKNCCSAACSVASPFVMHELIVEAASREFAAELVQAPMAINLGLPTPPPNTTS